MYTEKCRLMVRNCVIPASWRLQLRARDSRNSLPINLHFSILASRITVIHDFFKLSFHPRDFCHLRVCVHGGMGDYASVSVAATLPFHVELWVF